MNAETRINLPVDKIPEDCEARVVDLAEYGKSIEITKHNSDRMLHITSAEDDTTDMTLYDETGTAIAQTTIFSKAFWDLAPERIASILSICF